LKVSCGGMGVSKYPLLDEVNDTRRSNDAHLCWLPNVFADARVGKGEKAAIIYKVFGFDFSHIFGCQSQLLLQKEKRLLIKSSLIWNSKYC
jgi:hypothetical protein